MCPPNRTTPPVAPEPASGEPDETQEHVFIQVDDAFQALVDPDDLAGAVATVLRIEGWPAGEATLVITDDEAVRQLNRQYRGLDEPTDVLSFPAQDPTPGFVSAPEAGAYLGDILIALPFTQRQAAGLARPLRDELRLLAVHGALHLLGYDHLEPEEEARMWARQDQILAVLGP